MISFDEIVIASFLTTAAQRTLPRQIFSGVRELINPAIAAVAVLLVAMSGAVLAATLLLQRQQSQYRLRP